MPRTPPPFFRYSYFIAQVGYIHDQKYVVTVHGYVFTFYRPKPENKALVKQRVREVFTDSHPINPGKEATDASVQAHPSTNDTDMGNIVWYEAEEEQQVDSEEVRGVGFYYPRILINDRVAEKADIRRGSWRRVGDLVAQVIRGVFRF